MYKRGSLVTIAVNGDYGKPRPALVVQSELFNEHPSVIVLLITSELRDMPIFRISLTPSPTNGLRKASQVMIDKPMPVPADKMGPQIGCLDEKTMALVSRSLAVFLGIA